MVNVGNAKMSLAIEEGLASNVLSDSSIPGIDIPPEDLHFSASPRVAVPLTTEALDGPDIWMEPKMMGGNLFISDRLAKLLKAAKMTGGWGLKECPIVGLH